MWGGKERSVAAAMVMMSFTVMLTLASEDDISDEANRYKRDGVSRVPKGCPDKCGNVSIYYPFGIGPNKNCYLNKWFIINCTKTSASPHGVHKPYLRAFTDGGQGKILGISLESQTVTIQESISPLGFGGNNNNNKLFSIVGGNRNLSATPFSYSGIYNKFMLFGCGNALLTSASPSHRKLGGCTSWCGGKTTQLEQPCNGIDCCETYLNDDVKMYQLNFTNLFVNTSNYAFIVDQNWFAKSSPGSRRQGEVVVVPVVWQWSILHDYLHLPPSSTYACHNSSFSTSITHWDCYCKYPKKGNPYFANGCQGIYIYIESFSFLVLLLLAGTLPILVHFINFCHIAASLI
nr:wall-associated receptor kinase-like 1 [Ipomoea batatas]